MLATNGIANKEEAKNGDGHTKDGLVRLSALRPSPENDLLYRPVDPKDPEVIALSRSVARLGIKDPLVVTLDNFILSGHRRYAAAKIAGLKVVPVRVEPIYHSDPEFIPLLREYNRQRVKSFDEVLREETITVDPKKARQALLSQRAARAEVEDVEAIAIRGRTRRKGISAAKRPFLAAAQQAVEGLRKFWPLTDRQLHYNLLNDPPLRHASKPESRYQNDKQSYKDLCDLLTRGRLEGLIPWNAIDDTTRPVSIWNRWSGPGPFIRQELDGFLEGYYRDLMRSQPCHLEIVGEKNTIQKIIEPIAAEFCCPLTIGRGYASLPPRRKMHQRFVASGKEKLVLLVLSDFDSEGEDIPHSFARSMRDDFGIDDVMAVKVALTHEQVRLAGLQPNRLKEGSSRAKRFRELYGEDTYELEAVPPAALQQYLHDAIVNVIDIDLYNAEVEEEEKDAAHLEAVRRKAMAFLSKIGSDRGASTS